jgi:UDP-N-acetylmuramoyl-tripeptide--D-alanyl-D-alanine ligase
MDDPKAKSCDRMLLTENVLTTLQQLAQLHRKMLALSVIGITGSNGKTTTKDLLAAVLSRKFSVLCTEGNLNNHIGVPLTLLRLTGAHELAVIEMGANHPGEIRELANIAQPDFGLITNVGYAHLEGFGSLDGVTRAKGELYDFLRQGKGTVFLHYENERLRAIAGGIEQITYGTDRRAYISGEITDCRPFLGFRWMRRGEAPCEVQTQLVGEYNLWNALAAVAAGCYFNVPPADISDALAAYTPVNNRSQWKKTAYNELIIDTYNANLSSMQAALTNFAAMQVHPKAVILGDMLELGADSPRLHGEVIAQLRACDIERVLLCGERFSAAGGSAYTRFPDVEALHACLSRQPLKGYHILIKGSHGIHLEKIIECL